MRRSQLIGADRCLLQTPGLPPTTEDDDDDAINTNTFAAD